MISFADGSKDIGRFKDFDVLLSSYNKPKTTPSSKKIKNFFLG